MLVGKDRIALDRPVRRWVDDLLAADADLAPLTPAIYATAAASGDVRIIW